MPEQTAREVACERPEMGVQVMRLRVTFDSTRAHCAARYTESQRLSGAA